MQIKNIRQFYVFISCPNDVEDEKKIVEEVCGQLTETLRETQGIELITIDWKKSVLPQITGDDTQTLINDQIGQHDYEIYIGILWKHFGEKRANGLTPTQEEFQIALNNYKQNKKPFIQFYFKQDKFFPNDVEKAQQLTEVLRFKKEIRCIGISIDFEGTESFKKKIQDYLLKIVEKFDFLTAKETVVPKIQYLDVQSYLPRKICSTKDYSTGRLLYLTDKYAKDTLDTISDCKQIALLGDAGVGKTIELRRIASHFSKEDEPFYPFFMTLNKYVSQSISELLPSELDAVPESKRIIILDGLDEIESKNKNDAIRQIELFAEQNPNTHIVVSCRTNFYDSETEEFSGALNGFSSYVLLDLGEDEIRDYVNEMLNQKAKDFHAAISNNRLYELLKIPFYLTRLVKLFKENHALPSHKAEIFEQLLLDRIQLDISHFRTTKKELKRKQAPIIQALQRVALGMEILCRNYITDSEYSQIIEDENLRELIEHCTVWKKDETETVKWQFEHNNFQEYLAAKLLSTKPLSTLKEFMFFGPEHRKLIPSWSNTLSFLISISNRDDLIKWIIYNEPELAVKFESDRIETSIQINIFKEIFNHYKERQIWIYHEKFKYDELARFGQSDEIVEFILSEAEKADHYTTATNAIELLRYLEIPHNQRNRTTNLLIKCALGNNFGDQLQNRALMSLADLELNSLDVINKVTKSLQTSDSEWIRYGLYYFLYNSNYLDDNIDIFLDGIQYVKLDLSSTRGRLIDEHLHLRIGLEKAKSPHAIVKILKYFEEHPQDADDAIFEKSILVIAENAANAYSKVPSLFEAVKSFLEVLIDKYLDEQANQLLVFFDKTKTRLHLFREFLSQEKDCIERWGILALLADKVCIDFFVQQYEEGKLKDDDVLTFRNCLAWKNSALYSPFNDLLNAKTGNKFPLPRQRDYDKERKERTKRDINLLFDKQAFLNEIKIIFDTENKESLTNREIKDIRSSQWDNHYFSDLAVNNLYNLAKDQPVTFDTIEKTVNSWNWDWFCIHNVYEKLGHREDIILTDKQKTWIANWCYSHIDKVDFKKALITKSKGESTTSLLVVFLWYFLRKLNLIYPKNVLLDLLSYDWSEGGQMVGIEYLEALLSKHEITTRVLANLQGGIENDIVLKNHFDYCKRYEVIEVLPHASSELANINRGEDVRRVALETISDLSKTAIVNLENVLPQIKDDFKWNIIEKLVQNNSQSCRKYLLSILLTANEEEKLKSAEHLIRLQDLDGLKYYVNWVSKHKQPPEADHFDKSPLLHLHILESVPHLIDLLKLTYQPNFTTDIFHNFKQNILDSLAAIALQSDKNYHNVRKQIEDFINDNIGKIKNINFLNIFIERLDQKYYVSKSESLNITDVVTKLSSILDS